MEKREKIYLIIFAVVMTLLLGYCSNKANAQDNTPVPELAGVSLGSQFETVCDTVVIADIPGLLLTSPDLEGKIDMIIFIPYDEDGPIGLTYTQYNKILDKVHTVFRIRNANVYRGNKVTKIIFNGLDYELMLKIRETKDEHIFLVIELTSLTKST